MEILHSKYFIITKMALQILFSNIWQLTKAFVMLGAFIEISFQVD